MDRQAGMKPSKPLALGKNCSARIRVFCTEACSDFGDPAEWPNVVYQSRALRGFVIFCNQEQQRTAFTRFSGAWTPNSTCLSLPGSAPTQRVQPKGLLTKFLSRFEDRDVHAFGSWMSAPNCFSHQTGTVVRDLRNSEKF